MQNWSIVPPSIGGRSRQAWGHGRDSLSSDTTVEPRWASGAFRTALSSYARVPFASTRSRLLPLESELGRLPQHPLTLNSLLDRRLLPIRQQSPDAEGNSTLPRLKAAGLLRPVR